MQRSISVANTKFQNEASTEMVPLVECISDSEESITSSACNDEMIRALIYTTCYNVLDGVTITIRKLEREILAAGGSVCIVTTASGSSQNTNLVPEHENRRVLFMDNSMPIPFQSDPNDPSVSYHLGISLSQKIQDEMDDFQPNIIHITAPDFTSLHVHNYARKRQIPLMGTYHSNIPEYMLFVPGMRWVKPILEMFFRHIYNFLFRLYVPTPFIKNMLIDEQGMDRVTEVGVWGRGVDLERFNSSHRTESFRTKLDIAPDCPIVLYVGRLVPEKRVDIVATIIKRLTAQNVNFKCVIVGAGPAEYQIEHLPNTHHLGWLNGDELTEAYASSDVFLFPSSVETFGNVTLEAAASGLPLVVESKCSGHLVDHGENGYACEAGNVDAFFQGTLELCQDAVKRMEFSQKSIAKSQLLEQSAVVRTMLVNYQEVRKEFYEDYGGNHFNRDEAYRHEGSFQMGIDPRPFGWGIMEFVIFAVLKLTNRLINLAAWLQKRRSTSTSTNTNTSVVQNNQDDDDDEEAQTQTQALVEGISQSQKQAMLEEEEEMGPGCLCGILISIGDSPMTAKFVMFMLGLILFTWRVIGTIRRGCARRLCSKTFESIEHKMDAAFNPLHQKQKRKD